MRTDEFDYVLPQELIAAEPAPERGGSRLLVLGRETGTVTHRMFTDLPEYLRPGDVLVLNDTRVIRARLRGRRAETGGAVELLLLARIVEHCTPNNDAWNVMARPARKLKPGEQMRFGADELQAEVLAVGDGAERIVRFNAPDVLPILDRLGEVPLPPYIVQRRREMGDDTPQHAEDPDRYQTVYAQASGSVAAPTAGLHFSQQMLDQLQQHGVQIARVTLHVGAGTFKPVDVDDPREHPMHIEHYSVSEEAATLLNAALSEKRRIVAVGTTSVRTLESAFDSQLRKLVAGTGSTRLLILPGYEFKVVGALLTNFHLPKSTLLMLVSALAGRESVLAAYAEAIEQRYRFYSYGDAMLIV